MNEHLNSIKSWFSSLPLEHQYAITGGLMGGGAGAAAGALGNEKRRGSAALIGGALGGLGGAGIGYGLSRLAPPQSADGPVGADSVSEAAPGGETPPTKPATPPVSPPAPATTATQPIIGSSVGRGFAGALAGGTAATVAPSVYSAGKAVGQNPARFLGRTLGAGSEMAGHVVSPTGGGSAAGARAAMRKLAPSSIVKPNRWTVLAGLLGGGAAGALSPSVEGPGR